MKTGYMISIGILWILIMIQLVQLVRCSKLLKQQFKDLEELADLSQKRSQLHEEMLEEKQNYQEAKERLLATMLPDFDETSDDDTPPSGR